MTLILSGTDGLSDVDGSAATPAIRGTDANTGIFFPAADTIGFAEGGVEAMRLDSAGNMGLGVTPSAWGTSGTVLKAFQIGTGSSGGNFIAGANGFAGTFVGANSYYNGTNWIYSSTAAAAYYNVTAGSHAWYNAASGTAGNAITFTQAMTLDASGNLGVGITSPAARLDVLTTGSSLARFTRDLATDAVFSIGADNDGTILESSGINTMRFVTSGAERARINSSGQAIIGATSLTAGTTTANCLMTVGGTASPMMKWQSTTGPHAWDLYTSSGANFYFSYDASDKASINSSTGVYTALSDVNKKKDFEASTIGLAEVLQLQPKLFRMLDDADDSPKELGFIAQEVQSLIPQAYVEQEGGNGTFIGLQDRPIIAALTKAIQEQQAIITTLTDRITALEAK